MKKVFQVSVVGKRQSEFTCPEELSECLLQLTVASAAEREKLAAQPQLSITAQSYLGNVDPRPFPD